MILLANGCSFTEGYGLRDSNLSWPHQLGYFLGYNTKNLALGGASNDRIFRTTIEYLNIEPTPNLVVIGWTMLNRAELSCESGMYLRLTSTGCLPDTTEFTKDLSTVHKFWLHNLYNEYINFRNWINGVLHLQNYLDLKQIPYIFFSAIDTNYINEFINESDMALALADKSFQWRDRKQYAPFRDIHREYKELIALAKKIDLSKWIGSNEYSMASFLSRSGYITDSTGHFLVDGHLAWAKKIQEYI